MPYTQNLLIKSGTIVTASETFTGDILISGEQIREIGQNLSYDGVEKIDARGKLVMPGGVDPHTHFSLPMSGIVCSDDHYTGPRAAAFGGTTTALDFVEMRKGPLAESLEAWHKLADGKAAIDYGFHMNVSRLDKTIRAELPKLVKEGITTLKVFMAYDDLRLKDGEIFDVMRIAKEHGMLTMLHAEAGDVIDRLIPEALAAGHTTPEWHSLTRPAWGAVEATLRGISLAAQAEAAIYIVHMNAAGEVDMLKYARERGVAAMGETCPQYLFFTIDHLRRPDGAKWVCSPPMRTAADNARLWEGAAEGILQTIGTDHCPFFYEGDHPIAYDGQMVAFPGKELGKDDFTKIPNGLPGVEDRMPILWTYGVRAGKITPNQFVALTSTHAAKIFGLYPRKGTLLPGSDADIVIWDPERRLTYGVKQAHMRTDYNLYEGWELVGYPEKVFLRGRPIVDEGRWLGHPGMGQFLRRSPGAPVI